MPGSTPTADSGPDTVTVSATPTVGVEVQDYSTDPGHDPVAPFPLPFGNLESYDRSAQRRRRRASLGLFAPLSDSIVVRILDNLVASLPPSSAAATLSALSLTSTLALSFACDDDLWRRLAFRLFSVAELANAPFIHSWRATVLRLLASKAPDDVRPSSQRERLQGKLFQPIYSDILFHKAHCRTARIHPSWLMHNDVPRVSANNLTPSQFRARYEIPRLPVVLKDVATKWPALHKWTREYLSEQYAQHTLNAGGYSFKLGDYFRYCDAVHAADDQALYIFDSAFATKAPALADDFSVPPHFSDDLFALAGAERRPNYRWLIAGPARSGSSFHIDPNATSAWNAAVSGRKKWVFFPPLSTPPGISPSADGADVTAPVSVVEWFVNFYDRALVERCGALECTVGPGEIVFVPRGWWHCVLNVDATVAITQNFVSEANVGAVVRWLRARPEQVSGCRSAADAAWLAAEFPNLVVRERPHLRAELGFAVDSAGEDEAEGEQRAQKRQRHGLWDSLRSAQSGVATSETAPFSFSF